MKHAILKYAILTTMMFLSLILIFVGAGFADSETIAPTFFSVLFGIILFATANFLGRLWIK